MITSTASLFVGFTAYKSVLEDDGSSPPSFLTGGSELPNMGPDAGKIPKEK